MTRAEYYDKTNAGLTDILQTAFNLREELQKARNNTSINFLEEEATDGELNVLIHLNLIWQSIKTEANTMGVYYAGQKAIKQLFN